MLNFTPNICTMKNIFLLLPLLFCSPISCQNNNAQNTKQQTVINAKPIEVPLKNSIAKAYFASGCFWCVEAIFESVKGVEEVYSGYSGGSAKTATYSAVSAGNTRHAESVEVYYDPTVVSYETLLKVFFGSHDPTTLNQQGPDRGPQYRSAIFYQTPQERAAIEAYIQELVDQKVFSGKITTEVAPLEQFYMAEAYHQDYERLHPNQSYVRAVSIPRLRRFQAKFPDLIKGKAQ